MPYIKYESINNFMQHKILQSYVFFSGFNRNHLASPSEHFPCSEPGRKKSFADTRTVWAAVFVPRSLGCLVGSELDRSQQLVLAAEKEHLSLQQLPSATATDQDVLGTSLHQVYRTLFDTSPIYINQYLLILPCSEDFTGLIIFLIDKEKS